MRAIDLIDEITEPNSTSKIYAQLEKKSYLTWTSIDVKVESKSVLI